MKLDVLNEYIASQQPVAEKIKNQLNEAGIKPTYEQYPYLIAALKIEFGEKYFSETSLMKAVTDGPDDGGIDAVVFTKESLYIFDFKTSKGLSLTDARDLKNRIKDYFYGEMPQKPEERNKRIWPIIKKWHSSKKKPICINVIFVRDKKPVEPTGDVARIINEICSFGPGIKVDYRGKDEFYKKLINEDYFSEYLLPAHGTHKLGNKISLAEFLLIPVRTLTRLHQDHLLNNKNIFAQNVRIPKNRKIYTESIEATLKSQGKNFHLFHNGIVLVCSKFKIHDTNNYLFQNPQIINGAQTMGTLYKIVQKNDPGLKEGLSNAKLLCKIIETEDEKLIANICESSNTQKQVTSVDLRTNDDFQKELEVFFYCKSKYFYNRKPSSKAPKDLINLDYALFFQWAYAALLEKPWESKNAKNTLFAKGTRGQYLNIKKLISKNRNNIIRLADTGFVVKQYIKNYRNSKDEGLMKVVSLYLVAILYLKESTSKDDFMKAFGILKKFYLLQRRFNKTLTPNHVFNQDKTGAAWNNLKKGLKI